MRAHYKSFPDKRSKDLYERKTDEMQKGFAILYEKILIYTLHNVYGYGTKRIKALVDAMGDNLSAMHDDPIFWHKVDKDVIESLGFDYPRCDCEYMEKVFYKPPEIPVSEKRAAVAEMHKMKEFLSREKNV